MPPTTDRRPEPASHPLGTYGRYWDENHAFIAGFTSEGCPYGTPWQEADWLLDDPEFGDLVREVREDVAYLKSMHREPNDPPW